MPTLHRATRFALCLAWVIAGCGGAGTVVSSEEDALTFAAEADDLWNALSPDSEGKGLITPALETRHDDFDRVGVRFDATDDLELDARVRPGNDAEWSGWQPIAMTDSEDSAHDGHAELPGGGTHVQIRARTEDLAALSSLSVRAYTERDPRVLHTNDYVLPVPQNGVVLDDNERHFGACRSASGGSNSDCTREHLGIDIHAKIGTPVVAADEGVVIERSTNSGAGLYLNVRHPNGDVTRYLHLDRTRGVSVGSNVEQGQRIADVGERGRAGSGSHLHFELRRGGEAIDPAPHVGWGGLPRVDTAPTGRVDDPPDDDDRNDSGRARLEPGDRGTEVYRLQHILEAWRPGIMGGSLGDIDTATYGPRTLEAVHEAARELRGHENPSDDYTVGPLFWDATLDAVYARFSGSRLIRYEDSGPDIYRLQHALEAWRPGVMGGSLGSIDTAKYGPRTRDAIHEGARALRNHDDPSDTYVVGRLFWRALLDALRD